MDAGILFSGQTLRIQKPASGMWRTGEWGYTQESWEGWQSLDYNTNTQAGRSPGHE